MNKTLVIVSGSLENSGDLEERINKTLEQYGNPDVKIYNNPRGHDFIVLSGKRGKKNEN